MRQGSAVKAAPPCHGGPPTWQAACPSHTRGIVLSLCPPSDTHALKSGLLALPCASCWNFPRAPAALGLSAAACLPSHAEASKVTVATLATTARLHACPGTGRTVSQQYVLFHCTPRHARTPFLEKRSAALAMRRLVRPCHRFPGYHSCYLLAACSWLSFLLPSGH